MNTLNRKKKRYIEYLKLLGLFVALTLIVLMDGCGAQSSSLDPSGSAVSLEATMNTNPEGFWREFLIRQGDLPSFHNADDMVLVEPSGPMLRNFPGALLKVTQWIGNVEREGEQGGGVDLMVFADSESALKQYLKMSDGKQAFEALGEEAAIQEMSNLTRTDIYFLRCKVVVKVWGIWQLDPGMPRGMLKKEDVIHYVKKLDERIMNSFCSENQ